MIGDIVFELDAIPISLNIAVMLKQKNKEEIMSLTTDHAGATDCLQRWEDEGGAPPKAPNEKRHTQPNAAFLPRLKALERKHTVLDQNIIELSRRPSACVTELRHIKTQKLRVKDEITLLRRA